MPYPIYEERPQRLPLGQIRMLEITADEIAALADDDLRTLVAQLCESEMRARQLPTSVVTWGGHQDAPDAGIDVRVELPANTVIDGFIPRAATGFQVKKPNMPASAIASEMRPKGTIRPSIQDLADKGGGYIIVSARGSVSDGALRARRKAMRDAVTDIPNGTKIKLDFYDRNRIATWVRDHPGLVPWVRRQAGRPLTGWQSYGAWANPAEDMGPEYLVDDAARIRTGRREDGAALTVVDGINRIRDALRTPGKAVRLIGLSGVGKTRLVQALFDDRIGKRNLDPTWAIYTNISDTPDPTPVQMVTDLVAAGARAVVVVDNCGFDLHRRVAEVCKAPSSSVSVITVEYDIREDQPEATEVFEMEPSSTEMTEKLVRQRFCDVSPVDARTIAEFSGGNARMAIALASTVERGETVFGLTDEELFERLFRQRHDPDPNLLRAAQACALVYSFDGDDVTHEGELARLGQLVGQDAHSLYASVAELKRRDLVQARGVWRAVLPHAVANRLAALALQNVPFSTVERLLVQGAPERIKKSFSRRLGYLHGNTEARKIVQSWLSPGGLLSDVAALDVLHSEVFRNVAPVAPVAVLGALENAMAGPRKDLFLHNRAAFVRLVRLIAYDPALFDRCAEILATFAAQDEEQPQSEAAQALKSLFYAYLSGTHASVEDRIGTMERLLRSGDLKKEALGLEALSALLQSSHFMSSYDFSFGSHSRDFGYHPNFAEVRVWYATVLKSAERLAISDLPVAKQVPKIIAGGFRGLWTNARLYDDLERVSRSIDGKGHWSEGWIAVRQTLHYDCEQMSTEAKDRLAKLEMELRPENMVQKVRSIVFSQSSAYGLDDYEEDDADLGSAWERAELLAERLGEQVACEEEALTELLPEIVSRSGKLVSFGRGLADGAPDRRALWERLVSAFAGAPSEGRGASVLAGFLQRASDRHPELASMLLDDAVGHPVLGEWFPVLQCSVTIDKVGVERLRRSLALGLAPVSAFQHLAWGRSHESIAVDDLVDLVRRLAAKPNGATVGLQIVFYRLYSDRSEKRSHEPEVIQAGRELLVTLEIGTLSPLRDHELALIASASLAGEAGEPLARVLCNLLKKQAAKLYPDRYHKLFESLCKVQPIVVLDAFLGRSERQSRASAEMMRFGFYRRNPLATIPDDTVLMWCDRDPEARYVRMAAAVPYLRGPEDATPSEWSDIALKLIERAPDRVSVLKELTTRFRPSSWSGSRAAILESRRALLVELEQHHDPQVAALAVAEGARLALEVEAERKWEAEHDRMVDEKFE